MKQRGQAWGFDLIFATILFVGGIVIFYIYAINYPSEGKDTLDSLTYEGNKISDGLLSSGLPKNWNQYNVIRIGISTNGRINNSKLEELHTMTITDTGYDKTRSLFNTKFDYYFNFTVPMDIAGNDVNFIGRKPITPKNLIRITRFTSYNDKAVSMNIFIWDD